MPSPPESGDRHDERVVPASFLKPDDPQAKENLTAKKPNSRQPESASPPLGDDASRAVTPFRQWGMRATVADALGRIGVAAVPALRNMLRHPDAERRVEAAYILARIGPDAKDAVPALVQALRDPDQRVRKAAVRALGQIGPAAENAVGPLLQLLEIAAEEEHRAANDQATRDARGQPPVSSDASK